MPVYTKRIYEKPDNNDGVRILVDRIWPRGISKNKANIDHWLKNVGPSTQLRKWFNHDPNKFASFKEKYKDELHTNTQKKELEELINLQQENDTITLLFAAKDEKYNQAVVLKEILESPHLPSD